MRLCCLWIRKDFGFEILILLIHKLIAIKEHYAILGNSNCSAKKISFLEVLMLIWIHFGNKCQLRKNRLAESALWMEPLGKQTSAVTQSRRTVAKRGLASQDRGDPSLSSVSSGAHPLRITYTAVTQSLPMGSMLNYSCLTMRQHLCSLVTSICHVVFLL